MSQSNVTDTGRVCTACNQFKPYEGKEGYSKNGVYASGPMQGQTRYQSKCKPCVNAHRRALTAAKKAAKNAPPPPPVSEPIDIPAAESAPQKKRAVKIYV